MQMADNVGTEPDYICRHNSSLFIPSYYSSDTRIRTHTIPLRATQLPKKCLKSNVTCATCESHSPERQKRQNRRLLYDKINLIYFSSGYTTTSTIHPPALTRARACVCVCIHIMLQSQITAIHSIFALFLAAPFGISVVFDFCLLLCTHTIAQCLALECPKMQTMQTEKKMK